MIKFETKKYTREKEREKGKLEKKLSQDKLLLLFSISFQVSRLVLGNFEFAHSSKGVTCISLKWDLHMYLEETFCKGGMNMELHLHVRAHTAHSSWVNCSVHLFGRWLSATLVLSTCVLCSVFVLMENAQCWQTHCSVYLHDITQDKQEDAIPHCVLVTEEKRGKTDLM